MTEGTRRYDGWERVVRQEPNHNVTTSQSSGRGPEPAVTHAGPHDSPLSFPTFSIGNPWLFPCRATQMKGQKRKTLDSR